MPQNRGHAFWPLLVIGAVAATTNAQQAYVGSADNGVDLKINSAATGKVMVNDVDIMGRVAGQASRIGVLERAVGILQTASADKDEIIAALNRTLSTALNSIGQIAPLQTAVASLNVGYNPTCGPHWGSVQSPDDLRSLALRRCTTFSGDISLDARLTRTDNRMLEDAFESVRDIEGNLYIGGTGLTTLGSAFSNLETIGRSLIINRNTALRDLGSAFASLRTVAAVVQHHSGGLVINDNAVLRGIGLTAFRNLTRIGPGVGPVDSWVMWHNNNVGAGGNHNPRPGRLNGNEEFCVSAGPVLCPVADHFARCAGAIAGSPGIAGRASDSDAVECCDTFCDVDRVNCPRSAAGAQPRGNQCT